MALTVRVLERDDAEAMSPGKTCDNCLGGCAGGCTACACDGCNSNCGTSVTGAVERDSAPISPLED